MEDLKRLVKIISKKKQRQFPLLELKGINENSSKENIFFRHIKRGTVNTDDEAAMLLYNTKSDDDRFRMLKSRLKQKLLNHVFFLDFTENNQKSANQYEQECVQYLHQAKMLLFTGEIKVAKNLVLKALTIAERCEFTKYILQSLEDLIQIYSQTCQPHLFEDVINRVRSVRSLSNREVEAMEDFYHIRMMIVKSVNSRKQNLAKAASIIKKLEKLWGETKSFNVFEYLSQLTLLYKKLTGDFAGIISFLKDVELGMYKGHSLNIYRLDNIQIINSISYAYLRAWDFEKGLSYVEKNIGLFDKTSLDWFQINEIYAHLLIRVKKYKDALAIMQNVQDSKSFGINSTEDREKWILYSAYLQMIYAGNFLSSNFNFRPIIRDLPEYHKDREGYNFALIVFQFLYFLEIRDMKELTKRRDELKRYMSNHFKENFSYRSRTIYKLLNIVVENDMDLKPIQIKSRYLVSKLKENQIVGDVYQEIEVLPYEHLWDLTVRLLRQDTRGF